MAIAPIKFFKKRDVSALNVTPETIVTPHGTTITKPIGRVRASDTEQIATIKQSSHLFDQLGLINIILTNACNLKCDYCYEQHEYDFGRFSADSLKTVYDFLRDANDLPKKRFQFFGGEPLIHKKLILEFFDKHETDLTKYGDYIRVDMVTNGTLLTKSFIDRYFSYDFTDILISIDTDTLNGDHRNLSEQQVNHIFDMLSHIPQQAKSDRRVCIRNTISVETAPHIIPFVERMHAHGVRAMVIHPLTMSFTTGFVMWPESSWKQLRDDVTYLINKYPEFDIQFSEGVGVKGKSNCMVGSDMIAIDGSGDYSGCYFFTNMKDKVAGTILGNILDNKVFVDRYVTFQTEYEAMFEREEQCKTCDLHGECYQCPAGNLSTGDKRMFRPDGMCKEIESLYNELHDKVTQSAMLRKLRNIIDAVAAEGEDYIFAKSLAHLAYYVSNGQHIKWDDTITLLPPHGRIAGLLVQLLKDPNHEPMSMQEILSTDVLSVNVYGLYNVLADIKGVNHVNTTMVDDANKRAFYLTLIHMLILNRKGDYFNTKTKE